MPLVLGATPSTTATCCQEAAPSVVCQMTVPSALHPVSGEPLLFSQPCWSSLKVMFPRGDTFCGGRARCSQVSPRSVERNRNPSAKNTHTTPPGAALIGAVVGIGMRGGGGIGDGLGDGVGTGAVAQP